MLDFMQNIVKGADKELPKFGKYWELFTQGFFYLVFAIIVGVIDRIDLEIPPKK